MAAPSSTNSLVTELSQASGVAEPEVTKVLASLGLDANTVSKLKSSGFAFDDIKVADLRISAKVGGMVVAR